MAQESIDVVLGVLVCELRALEQNIKELDKAIKQLIVIIPEYQYLTSIPGIGKVYAANSVKNYLPEYRAFYQSKYKEVPKQQHKRAFVLTARKFTRLVDTLLRNHQLYTPPRSVIDK